MQLQMVVNKRDAIMS